MPKYRVKTDQGTYSVELDREPASPDELNSIVAQQLGGGQAQAPSMQEPEPALPQSSMPTEPPERTMSAGEVVTSAIKNIPSSALQYGKNIVSAVTNPIDTAGAVLKTAAGGVQAATRGSFEGIPEGEDEAYFNALKEGLKERYGGMENIKRTIAEDPVGFAGDVSTVLLAAGGLTQGAGKLASTPGVVKAGEAVTKAGKAVEPLGIVGAGGRAVAKAIPEKIPQRLYGSAVKFSTKLDPTDRIERIATGLREGIIPGEKGLAQISDKIDDLNKQIQTTISSAATRGEKLQTDEIVKRIDDLKPFYQNTLDPKPYLDDLDNLKKAVADAHGTAIPVDKAQQIKQNTYKLLRKHYGEMKGHMIEGQKALARGIKEELATKYPELNSLNKTESELIKLEESIEKALGRIENRDLVGIGSTIAGTAAATVTGSPSVGIGAMLTRALIDHPKLKARIAIALQNARIKGIIKETKGQAARPLLDQAGRIQRFDEEEAPPSGNPSR